MTRAGARTGLVRSSAELLYAAMHVKRGGMVRPIDEPVVRAGDDDAAAMRILFVANGLAHGWGVATHQLAPTGALAREVAATIGAPCEVEFVGDAAMSVASAATWIDGRVNRSFHGAVLSIGSNDALRLTPPGEWEERFTDLLDAVQEALPEGAPVVVTGIPQVVPAARVRRMRAIFRRRARLLDAATERVVAGRLNTRFLPAPDLSDMVGEAPGAPLYAAFAETTAVAVVDAVSNSGVRPTAPARVERFEHRESQAILEAGPEDTLQALQEIVLRSQSRFNVTESAVTLVDGDRTWHVAHTGKSPTQVPRSLTYCDTVVTTDDALIIENATRDPRFADNPFLSVEHARFYAGVPIHGADGTPIGALCLLNGFARSAGAVDLDELRALALEAEAVIQDATAARALTVEATSARS